MNATSSCRLQRLLHVRNLLCVAAALALLLSAPGCTTGINPVTGNRRAYGYSWEQEKQIGAQQDKLVQQQYGVYDNEQVQQYVRRLGEEVLAESDLRRPDADAKFRNTEFTFRVMDSDVVNAFALPGGYVYVTRGLMTHLNNEAQLAMVLGHEIAHVAARHSSQQAAKQQLGQLALIGGALGGQAAGLPGGDILQLGGQAAQLLFLKYSRENESESDELGVEYSEKAGFASAEGAEFFRSLERIQQQSGQALPTFLSTHPDPGGREQRIQEMAADWDQQLPQAPSQVNQDEYYRVLEGIVMGNDPRQGYAEGGVFYHPQLRFQFPVPQGFQLQNTPAQVIMADQNGQAQMVFTFAEGVSSAREAVQRVASQQGVQVQDQGQLQTEAGVASYVLADAQTQQGQRLRVLATFVEYDGQVYTFQALSTPGNFSSYEDNFLQAMRGFGPVQDRSKLSVEPTRLRVVAADRTAPFQSFVPQSLPQDLTAEDLAILNQVQLDTQIEAGQELKLPTR